MTSVVYFTVQLCCNIIMLTTYQINKVLWQQQQQWSQSEHFFPPSTVTKNCYCYCYCCQLIYTMKMLHNLRECNMTRLHDVATECYRQWPPKFYFPTIVCFIICYVCCLYTSVNYIRYMRNEREKRNANTFLLPWFVRHFSTLNLQIGNIICCLHFVRLSNILRSLHFMRRVDNVIKQT